MVRIMVYPVGIMRTTITLPDQLLIDAKRLAAERRTSLTRLLEESLRRYIAEERSRAMNREAPSPLPVVREARPVAGVDLDDTSSLWELA
jgi:hypothetical protein